MFLFALLTSPSQVEAQCPTGWNGPFTTTINVVLDCGSPTLVPLTVTYCTPGSGVGPSRQYKITGVSGVPATCTFTGDDMREIGKKLIVNNPANFGCNGSCPIVMPQWVVGWQSCWYPDVSEEGVEWIPCDSNPDAESCVYLYHVCCACDGTLTPFYKGSTPPGSCDSPNPNCVGLRPALGTPQTVNCP